MIEEFVLKRIFCEKGEELRRSGDREIFFGGLLKRTAHIARFVESFNKTVSTEEGRGNHPAICIHTSCTVVVAVFH